MWLGDASLGAAEGSQEKCSGTGMQRGTDTESVKQGDPELCGGYGISP